MTFRVKDGISVNGTQFVDTSTNVRALSATITSTADASGANTGALQVAGGGSLSGSLYVAGVVTATSFVGAFSGAITGVATTATNIAGGATGSLPYQSSGGTTAMLGISSTAGYVLSSTGSVPQWSSLSSLGAGSATTATNIAGGTAGQLPYQSAAGTTAFTGPGTAGQILVSNGTSAPAYQNTLTLAGATASSSTTTGALVVVGGLGVGGNLNVGGTISVGLGAAAVSSSNGDLTLAATGGNVTTTNLVIISNTTGVTSTTTGALRVSGGVGVGGGLFVGGVVTATSFAGSLTGNADTATSAGKWTTARTFTFGGDLSGSMVVDGSQNVTFTATIAADSIALGTDTTGNYVATATAGTGISVAGSGSETAAITITNLGVTGLTAGTGIATNGSTGSLTLTNVGVTSLTGGGGVTVSASTGSITLGFTTSTLVQTASNLAGGTAGQLAYQSAGSTTAFTGPGTAGQILVSNGTSAPAYQNTLTLAGTTVSSSTTTGALVVAGGLGVGGDLNIGGTITAGSGAASVSSTGDLTLTATGGNVTTTNVVIISNTSGVTSAATGALRVAGGVGVGGGLFVGGTVTATSFVGAFAGTVAGNADTATKWATPRTFTFGGDLSGSMVVDGSQNVTFTATIAADSVALGTDTTGNYVATGATSGYGLSGSSSSEGGAFTVTSNGTSSNTVSTLVFRDDNGDFSARSVTLTGNLVVQGTTFTVNSTVTNVSDPIFTIGGGAAGAAPSTDDNKDRGIAFQWHNGAAAKIGFFGYDDSTGFMTFVPDATITNEVVSGTKGSLDANLAGGTTGQLVYQSAANTTAFAGPGTTGQILVSGGAGAPVYTNTGSIYVSRAVTADSASGSAGSVANALTIGSGLSGGSFNGSSAVTITNLGVGSLTGGGGVTVSASTGSVTLGFTTSTLVTTASNLAGGTAGQLHYQSSGGTTAFAGPGTAGQLLMSAGTSAPTYTNTASIYVANATKVDTIAQTASANYYVTFVDANNATAAQEVVGTTSTLTINPATGAVGGTSLTLSGATASSSTTTGALVVSGGAGIGGNLNVGGTISVGTGAAVLGSTGDLTLTATGGNVTTTNIVVISNTTGVTSAATGALRVAGGVGVGGGLFVGGTVTATSFVGAFAGTVSGNADTASKWATPRTFTFGGDLSGSMVVDGSQNVTFTATIAADSVALGTDTTGNYVATAAAGTGIAVAGSGSETAAITITNLGVTSLAGTAPIAVSASTGSVTVSLTTASTYVANAVNAEKWLASRTVTFAGGDVTGSFSIDGSANVSNVALTIAADSVALGTDTTGNYVSGISAGTAIAVAGSGAENATVTITNLGVTGLTAGGGVTVSASTGSVTLGFTTSTLVTTASNLAGGTAGQLHYQSAAGTSAFAGPGTAGQILVSAGTSAPVYTSTSSIYVNRAVFADSASGSAGSVANALTIGSGLSGGSFNGSAAVTITNLGVTSLAGTAPIAVSASTGSVTISLTTASTYVANATKVDTVAQPGNATYYATFVDANNAVGAQELVYTTSTFTVNPSTGALGATSLTLTGNLIVQGTTFTVNSTVTNVSDPIFTIGGGAAGAAPSTDDNKDRGIAFQWHNGAAAKVGFFGFDDSTGYLAFVPDATITNEVVSGSLGDIQATNFRGILVGSISNALTIGTGLGGTSYNGSGAVTITNSGVLSNVAGTGISVSGATGNVTITNSGVTSNVAGTGISVSGGTGAVTITNSGVTSLTGGGGVTVSGGTGGVTLGFTTSTLVTTASNLAGGTAGQLHYQSAAGTTAFAGPGTAGQILVSAGTGAPTYTNTGSIYVNRAVTADNGGVTSIVAGTGVSISGGTGAVTVNIGQAVATSSNVQFNSLGVGTAGSATAGEIRATNEITAYYSDRRLKENVKVIDNAVTKVLSLNGITYTPNELAESFGYDRNVKLVGLFADEVEAILPEATRPAPFDQDENGNSKSGENYKTIQYEKLVPLLIEAIKEQQQQIAQLYDIINNTTNK